MKRSQNILPANQAPQIDVIEVNEAQVRPISIDISNSVERDL